MAFPKSADANNKFEDLSGVDSASHSNPYEALIEACHDDPVEIQARYDTHRTTRNAQQKAALLSPSFKGLNLDGILQRLEDPSIEPGFADQRNCLVFWARPPKHIRELVDRLQTELKELAPNLWLMPLQKLHLTVLEITHSLTAPEITSLLEALGPSTIQEMTDYTYKHRARLSKPIISFDSTALALSFLPGPPKPEPKSESNPLSSDFPSPANSTKTDDDKFTYHHLRRDLFNLATEKVSINSRYVVPSSHITIGRFLTQTDHDTPEKMQKWIQKIESINAELQRNFCSDGQEGVEWIVGHEKGIDCREGLLWYGGGRTVRLGKGF